MNKKLTKKQLIERLNDAIEPKVDLNEVKSDLESAYSSLKKAKQKIKDSNEKDNKSLTPLKKAMRFLSDELDEMEDITKSEEVEEEEQAVIDKNEQSEGHGKMFNSLKGADVRENKIISLNQSTLKRIVERVIESQRK
jgi:seryl-tRNA synthetase